MPPIPTPHDILKHQVTVTALGEGPCVRIAVWSEHPQVVFPEGLGGEFEHVVPLDIGYGLERPIPDLIVDEFGVRGTLSFGSRGPCHVSVPWAAIVYISAGTAFELRFGSPELAADLEEAPQQTAQKTQVKHASARARGAKKGLHLV